MKRKELEAVLERWVSEEREPEEEATVSAANDGSATREDSEEDPLDREVLASLRGLQEEGEPNILNELIELFLEEAPPQLAALGEAIEGGDARTVERVAHTLKGSSGNMGARRMVAVCAELEKVGGSGELTRAPQLLERLEVEFERTRQALNAELPR